jgi:hypothetical protein
MQKYFLHPSFSYAFFFNLTRKTETGTASMWNTINSNPLGPIKLSSQYVCVHRGQFCLRMWLQDSAAPTFSWLDLFHNFLGCGLEFRLVKKFSNGRN